MFLIFYLNLFFLGISNISQVLKKDFDKYLQSALYPLLETYEDANRMVNESSRCALKIISNSIGYNSVNELILDNVDHLVNSACQKLRYLTLNPSVPRVLCATINQVSSFLYSISSLYL